MIPHNKRQKTPSPNDRISQLPDETITQILSCLPTVDATQTSLLSQSWRNKWTSIYDIHLDDKKYSRRRTSFINFVFRILVTCNARIRSFSLSLSCDNFYPKNTSDPRYLDPKYVETWISCVLRRNVEILKISARNFQRIDSCFHNWTLLTELELCMNCTLVIPVDNLLPNLKRLSLDGGDHGGIKIKQEQNSSDGRMILIFPVLEYLSLKCDWLDVNFVEIHAPELITFDCFCEDKLKHYEITIFGPKLTTFRSKEGIINNIHLHGSPAVSYVELDHFLYAGHEESCLSRPAHKILEQLPNLKCLYLLGNLLELLVPSNSELVFPTFDRLRELHLGDTCYIQDAMELLQLLPKVELLNIDVTQWDENRDISWDPKIVSNMKTVELNEFSGHKPQLDFLLFILENAKKLQKVTLVVDSEAPGLKATIDFMSKLLCKPSSCVIEVL